MMGGSTLDETHRAYMISNIRPSGAPYEVSKFTKFKMLCVILLDVHI